MAREKGKSIKENDLIMLTVIGQTVKNLKLKKGEIILKWAPVGCAMVRRGQRQIQQRPSVATLWLLIVKSTAHCSRAQNYLFARWDLLCGTWWDLVESHQSSVLRALLKRILKFKDRLKDTS